MKRVSISPVILTVAVGLTLSAFLFSQRHRREAVESRPPVPGTEAEKQILGVLDRMIGDDEVYLEVSTDTGRMLRLLTEAVGAKNVVEIGTSTGYSGLWLSLGLQATGGKLTTFEIDAGRAAQARRHF